MYDEFRKVSGALGSSLEVLNHRFLGLDSKINCEFTWICPPTSYRIAG
jgi:hypothetical protein